MNESSFSLKTSAPPPRLLSLNEEEIKNAFCRSPPLPPCPNCLAPLQEMHFWSIKGVYFFQNASLFWYNNKTKQQKLVLNNKWQTLKKQPFIQNPEWQDAKKVSELVKEEMSGTSIWTKFFYIYNLKIATKDLQQISQKRFSRRWQRWNLHCLLGYFWVYLATYGYVDIFSYFGGIYAH